MAPSACPPRLLPPFFLLLFLLFLWLLFFLPLKVDGIPYLLVDGELMPLHLAPLEQLLPSGRQLLLELMPRHLHRDGVAGRRASQQVQGLGAGLRGLA